MSTRRPHNAAPIVDMSLRATADNRHGSSRRANSLSCARYFAGVVTSGFGIGLNVGFGSGLFAGGTTGLAVGVTAGLAAGFA